MRGVSIDNALGVPCTATEQWVIAQDSDLPRLHQAYQQGMRAADIQVLGQASNVVLPQQLSMPVVRLALGGCQVVARQGQRVIVELGAGESWHDTVVHLSAQGYHGIENLALIPGQVGAAPVQNIGAYGVELADVLDRVQIYDWRTGLLHWLTPQQCCLGYRDSVFKQPQGRYWLITRVRLALSCTFAPVLSYAPLQALSACQRLTAVQLIEQICSLRRAKLPDPQHLPNAGSFFKNPIIDQQQWQRLQQCAPEVVTYAHPQGYKVAAGWLIEQCGYRGYANALGIGCYQHQALVVVNPQRCGAQRVLAFAAQVQAAVAQRFAIDLQIEPICIDDAAVAS